MGSITPYQRLLEFQHLTDVRGSGKSSAAADADKPTAVERALRALHRNWKPIAGLAGIGLILGLAIASIQTPVYRGKTVFEVQIPNGEKSDAYLQTQLRLLDSDGLLWTAAVKSGLVETSEYSALARNAKLESIRRNLAVNLSGATRIVTVDFEAHDPAAAADFANELVQSYRSAMRGRHLAATRQTLALLETQVAERSAKADLAQSRLIEFAKVHRYSPLETLDARLRDLRVRLNKTKNGDEALRQRWSDQLAALSLQSSQYQVLRQELDQQRAAHNEASRRLQDATANATILADHLSILDTAHRPEEPVRPNKASFVIFGLCSGLIVGLLVARERESRSRKIEAHAKANAELGVPQLGVAPPAWIDAPKSEPKHLAVAESRGRYALWNFHNPGSAHAEAYRDIVTSLMFASERSHDGHLRVVVTSANASEGRTTAAVNLATGIAETGCRVLLIDGNRGKQALHEIFDAPDTTGFFQAVAMRDGLTAPVFASDVRNLFVMPAGPFNNALLDVSSLRKVLEDVRETYDVILIDAPPVLGHADARWFSRVCDGAVLVHDPRISTARDAQAALSRLHSDGIHVFGTLLNQWSSETALVRASSAIPEIRIRLRITS